MTEAKYKGFANFFENHPLLFKLLTFIYKYLVYVFGVAYFLLLCFLAFNLKENFLILLKVTLIPAFVFVFISVFRKIFNFKRPYEIYNIKPLFPKDKKGYGFPSRHTASAFIIGMCFLYVNSILGIVFLTLAFLIGMSRILAGVHFIKDVLVGGLFSVIIGLFLFL